MGLKISKKLNEIDPVEQIEFFTKQTSNLSTGLTSESSDLIIDDVLSKSESSESINSTDTPNLSGDDDADDLIISKTLKNNNNNNNRLKIKNVRFNEKVMVICTTFSRFNTDSIYNDNNNISAFKLAKFYFIDLKDDKCSKKSKIRFLENHRDILKSPDAIPDTIQEFNLLRSCSMYKEDTFFLDKTVNA